MKGCFLFVLAAMFLVGYKLRDFNALIKYFWRFERVVGNKYAKYPVILKTN